MMRAVANVIRGEGLASAACRAHERIGDAFRDARLRMRGGASGAAILNVSSASAAARTGGVAVQLLTRLHAESALREIALLHPGGLQFRDHLRGPMTVREALRVTGAKTVHYEGTAGMPIEDALRLREEGIDVVVSVHDFSLFCERPHLLEVRTGRFCEFSQDRDRCVSCVGDQSERRALGRRLLTEATGVVFPSQFLYDRHRALFGLPELRGEVIEPAVPGVRVAGGGDSVAFAGSVMAHKGAHLLAEIARDTELHVFGGGDAEILRALRRHPNIRVQGYYRAGTLPALLARHRIGLVVLPSVVPESYSIALTEAWLAGARVAAFELGAIAERIRNEGGGWLAPLDSGAAGIAAIVDRWRAGALQTRVPEVHASGENAARAHIRLYAQWGLPI